MSTWLALRYDLKAGHEDQVRELFKQSGRPDHEVRDDDGNVAGQLLTTIVFVGREIAVRVIEVEGDPRVVAGHMSRQPEVKEFEQKVEEHLSVPRDMRSAEGAKEFFQRAGMQCALLRRKGD